MSWEDSKRARQRQRQARYEARLRAGVMLLPSYLVAISLDSRSVTALESRHRYVVLMEG
jgi:hypothetical protein